MLANNNATTGDYNQIKFQHSQTDTSFGVAIRQITVNGAVHGGTLAFLTDNTSGTLTEAMRITSGGFLKASNTGTYLGIAQAYHELKSNTSNNYSVYINNSSASPYGCGVNLTTSTNNGTNQFYAAEEAGVTRFLVYTNGGIANFSANDVNLSDERTKKDI